MSEIIIDVKNLSCKAGYRYLLKDINWQVKQGEHWVVFGMNGSGKTTLLSILAGFKQHTHGEFMVFGEKLNKENVLEIRKKIGWVSSSFFDQCYSKESPIDIVLSGKFGTLGLNGDISNEDIKKAKYLLSELHLADKIYRPFHMMSRGERQNVLIARALFSNPDLLILDEPCTGLDLLAREHLLNTVRDLAMNTNITIIYVTHYTEEILDIFAHSLLLKEGVVYAQGLSNELFTPENMEQFLDYPIDIGKRTEKGIPMTVEVVSKVRTSLWEGGRTND